MSTLRDDALQYHARGRKGKIQVVPTKPTATQRDLALAYSPGVAEPCREIARDPMLAYEYTAKSNLVGVISNGTAVLGLGNIGALAGKPVMEGKGVLFKRFADIDVFDLELASEDVDELVRTIEILAPTFGGINLEDIRAPECFEVERRLKERLDIPVFHDDQHGTAIISAAFLLNALELVGKRLDQVRVVFAGAGAAAIGCLRHYRALGLPKEHVMLVDRKGVVWRGRPGEIDATKAEYAAETDRRTLAEALEGADVFVGLASGGLVDGEMLRRMAKDPIVMAMANPDPEISWSDAMAARDDVVMATGRSDFPNQVNNVLGFPFIFRGALDVRAKEIDQGMMLAATQALAQLAREDVPDAVLRAYGVSDLRFGREYLIPKPFDTRVLLEVAPAVARAAVESGVARVPIRDFEAYRRRLETLVSRRYELMRGIRVEARRRPMRVVFPEGENDKILRAAKILIDEGIAEPILLARREVIAERLVSLGIPEDKLTLVHNMASPELDRYAQALHQRRRRRGVTLEDAQHLLRSRNWFGSMMVEMGDADGLVSGLTRDYSETIRPALATIGTREGVSRVCGAYALALPDRLLVLADTTVNIDPSAAELAEIAVLAAELAARFGVRPQVAMLSFSNFGSSDHAAARKVREAVRLASELAPDLAIDGEMQADTAIVEEILRESYPWSRLEGPANVLVFPELQSANVAYKLIWRLADAEAIGPILLGMKRPVHVLQRGVEVTDIVNLTAICVVEAQEAARRAAAESRPVP